MDRTFIEWRATEADHLRAREIAQAVLDGRTAVLEGVRQLVYLAHSDAVAELEDRRFAERRGDCACGGIVSG